ncbi:hypothetical protein CLOBOL_00348 [Enterocloster bolteae ATCC BAA-613]|uniref:Uncharacterized protein n=1 Tax=Enterocloster bolteae (strain ATCC BAA-613 / DSM 15670 / CCUG 46953 / JCM 12243 / WAL 16351) TaxID=411902 RepID=A8RH90_ENTBW|nr:hypothetical protein CLOBOL_00348 [Enterocloster bolteae ATCC BAA-613]
MRIFLRYGLDSDGSLRVQGTKKCQNPYKIRILTYNK